MFMHAWNLKISNTWISAYINIYSKLSVLKVKYGDTVQWFTNNFV